MSSARFRSTAGLVAGLVFASGLMLLEPSPPAQAAEVSAQLVEFEPGMANLDLDGRGSDVSCSSRGDCMAVGSVADLDGFYVPYALIKRAGRWEVAHQIPGVGETPPSQESGPFVHCTGKLDCTVVMAQEGGGVVAVGYADGAWGSPERLRLPMAYPHGPALMQLACGPEGRCIAVGRAWDASSEQLLVFEQREGSWGVASVIDFPMVPSNKTTLTIATGASCPAEGSCAIVGHYMGASVRDPAKGFVVQQSGGVWGPAAVLASADPSQIFYPNAIDCGGVGSCAVAGLLQAGVRNPMAATLRQRGGSWGVAEAVAFEPGSQSTRPNAAMVGVSCAAVDTCTAVGYARDALGAQLAVSTQLMPEGWSTARPVRFKPGETALQPASSLSKITCFDGSTCTAYGNMKDPQGRQVGFSANMLSGTWGDPQLLNQPSGASGTFRYSLLSRLNCVDVDRCAATGFVATSTGMLPFVYDVGFAPSHFEVSGATELSLSSARLSRSSQPQPPGSAVVKLRLRSKGLPAPRFKVVGGLPGGLTLHGQNLGGVISRRGSYPIKVRVENRWGSMVKKITLRVS